MIRLTATDVLHNHARERWLRRAIRSVALDGDLGALRRMTAGEWVESCLNVVGVVGSILDVLGVRECHASAASWIEEAREVMGEMNWVPSDQVGVPPTLVQAARYLGLAYSRADLNTMRLEAIGRVSENMLRRRGAGENLSRAQNGASS